MLIVGKVGDRLAKVPEKSVTGLSAVHDLPGQNRHPGDRIISATLSELGDHIVGPILRAGFPAVVDHIAHAPLTYERGTDGLLIAIEVSLEILLHKSAVELIDLKTRGLSRGWMVGDSEQRVAEAQHYPLAGRRSPVERTIRVHL